MKKPLSAKYTDHRGIYITVNLNALSNEPSVLFVRCPSLSQEMIEFLIKKGPT